MSLIKLLSIILIAHFAAAGVSQHDPFYCYSNDPIRPQYGMFSTKVSYETVRGKSIDPSVSSCTPSRFWFVSRHGTRLPIASEIVNIRNNAEALQRNVIANFNAGKSSLCSDDFNLIRNWQFDPNITVDIEQELSLSGWSELEGIGRRFSQAFPTLLPPNYSPDRFLFRSTGTARTQGSLQAFADGVFGQDGHLQIQFEAVPNPDLLLVPYNYCGLYLEVYFNQTEHLAFAEGPEYQQALTDVSQKLGFLGSKHLRQSEIELIEILCKYEHMWVIDEPSPWCAAFSVANHETIEYFNDINHYWRMGNGPEDFRPLYGNINCHLMQDLLQFVTSDDPNDHLSRMYSTHVGVISLLMVTLDAFEDHVPLTRHNFAQQAFRQWRSSEIIPMAANLAIVKYSCADDDDDLLFMLNEKPLRIPGCQPNGLCKQAAIVERFNRFLSGNCDQIFCNNSNA